MQEAEQGMVAMYGPGLTGTHVMFHQLIGDSYVMLFKICPTDGFKRRTAWWKSDRWHYVPISTSSSDIITMGAKDRSDHTLVLFIVGNADPSPSLSPLWHFWLLAVLVTQLCLALCDPMDCSPPSSSVHGMLQARILEWVATSSRGSSQPRDQTHISCISADSSPSEPPGETLMALLTKLSQDFSKSNVNPRHLGILLKYRFCFGVRPETLHLYQVPRALNLTGPQTIFWMAMS